jgi:AraC-like DNA-binding protein
MEEAVHLKYLIVNDVDRLWGLTVNSVGFQSVGPGDSYPPGNHPTRYLFSPQKGRILDEYQLLYITRGRGRFSSQTIGRDRKLPLVEGNMFLLFPGEWHNYQPDPSTGWDEYWIGFQGDVIDARVRSGFFDPCRPILSVGISDGLVSLYRRAVNTAVGERAGYQQVLAGIVDLMLGTAYSRDRNYQIGGTEVEDRINRAKIIISEEFSRIKPQQVADRLNMSYSSFRKIFREYTGFAPMQYIQELKIRNARELLTNTGIPIKEIAFRMGFENHEYFFTAFRKNTGVTPLHYRHMTQGR